MPIPTAYLDEGVDAGVVPGLQRRGLVVTTPALEGTLGLPDAEQLRYAGEQGYILVTHDERDFRRWHHQFQQLVRRMGEQPDGCPLALERARRAGRGPGSSQQIAEPIVLSLPVPV